MKGSGGNVPPLWGISTINLKVSIPVRPVQSADTSKWETSSACGIIWSIFLPSSPIFLPRSPRMFYYGTVFPNIHGSCSHNRCQMSFEAVMAEVSPVSLQQCGKDIYYSIILESSGNIWVPEWSESYFIIAQQALTAPTPCDLLMCLERAATPLWSSTRDFSPLS